MLTGLIASYFGATLKLKNKIHLPAVVPFIQHYPPWNPVTEAVGRLNASLVGGDELNVKAPGFGFNAHPHMVNAAHAFEYETRLLQKAAATTPGIIINNGDSVVVTWSPHGVPGLATTVSNQYVESLITQEDGWRAVALKWNLKEITLEIDGHHACTLPLNGLKGGATGVVFTAATPHGALRLRKFCLSFK